MSKLAVALPYIAWRNGRPRFQPGPRERLLGFKNADLRHADGRWFTLSEAEEFARERRKEIAAARGVVVDEPALVTDRGFVYFLRCGDWLKIGFSRAPLLRAGQVTKTQAYAIEAIVAVPGTRFDEARLHRALAGSRINGEWFRYDNEAARIMLRSATFGRPIASAADETAQPREKVSRL